LNYKWTVLTVTTIGVLMAGIDSRIIIVGLPQVAAALGADAEQAIWFTQSYTLGSTIILLLVGRVTDIFGRVKIYISGFLLFTLGSALISLSATPTQVILFRFLQGVGSGILSVNSVAMIVDATPIKELGFALGLNFSSFRFGAMAGLTLSGVLLALLDWRALFYINVPIGIFGIFWAWKRLKEVGILEKSSPIDWVGFLTFTVSITTFLFALTYDAYGMVDRNIVYILLAIAILSIAAFVRTERRLEHPLLDLRLLGIREFTGGVTAQLINAAAWGAVLLLLSLYLQLVVGLSPFDAGIRLIPFELASLAFGALSGKLSDRYGPFLFTTSGLAVTSLSLYLFSTVDASTPYLTVLAYMMIFGVGTGLFGSPNMSSIMGSVPADRRGVASAFRNTMFNVGFTISLNLAVILLTLIVPYPLLSEIITSLGPVNVTAADKLLFVEALQRTYLYLAVLNTIAIIPSILRGRRTSNITPHSPGEATMEV
jgi:EmrB/QacA subfamily drug resistance transporter